jgi:TPR repeat protein
MRTSFASRQPLVRAALTAALAVLPPTFAAAQELAKPEAATAQSSGTSAPVVTEARRREILQAASTLTSETFADVLRRAEAGEVESQVLAGIALEEGKAVPKDIDAAVRWVRTAAEKGHPMAQNMLGNMYRDATGMPRDAQKAVEWYTKAAAQGYAQGQSNLGAAYADGFGGPANPVEAVRLFRLAAEQDNLYGQFCLGLAYALGKGVKKNLSEAAVWYQKAAEGGSPGAQLYLGVAYFNGEGVAKDKTEAEKWLKKSSEQGNALGSFHYGLLNLEKPGPGRLDPIATRVGVDSLKLSAEQGHPVAAFVVGEIFSGRMFKYHVETDNLEACTWYVIASGLDKQGRWAESPPETVAAMRRDLPGRIDKVRKSLGGTEYAACERRASDWMVEHPQRQD